jgi:hemoglobin-like flavoprotein
MKRAVAMLAVASALALAFAAAIVAFVLRADFLTAGARAIAAVALDHAALAIGAAVSPLVATLLVGYAYMQRGMRRRAAAKAAGAPAAPHAGRG